jgi:hypothetical protein
MANPDVEKLPDAFAVTNTNGTSGFSKVKYPLGDGIYTFSPTKSYEEEVELDADGVADLGLAGKHLAFAESKNHGLTVHLKWDKNVKVMGIINKGNVKILIAESKVVLKHWKQGVGNPSAPMKEATDFLAKLKEKRVKK